MRTFQSSIFQFKEQHSPLTAYREIVVQSAAMTYAVLPSLALTLPMQNEMLNFISLIGSNHKAQVSLYHHKAF